MGLIPTTTALARNVFLSPPPRAACVRMGLKMRIIFLWHVRFLVMSVFGSWSGVVYRINDFVRFLALTTSWRVAEITNESEKLILQFFMASFGALGRHAMINFSTRCRFLL